MDEKSTRVETARRGRTESVVKENPAAAVNRLRAEINDARDGLGAYVSELDRRRHEALDLKLQLKRHKGVGIGVGVVTISAVAGAVAMMVKSRRHAAQIAPWAPGRTSLAQKSGRLGKFLLATVAPVALKAARAVAERGTSRRLRSA